MCLRVQASKCIEKTEDLKAFVVLLLTALFACAISMVAVTRMETLILCYHLNKVKH